jgi:hypothetical protein
MDNYANLYGNGKKRKTHKKTKRGGAKRPMSEYNKFVQHFMLQGMPMAQVAAEWRKLPRR